MIIESWELKIEKYFFNVLHSGFWDQYFLRKCFVGMKNEVLKLRIVILQDLVGEMRTSTSVGITIWESWMKIKKILFIIFYDALKLRIVILQELVGKKWRIENGKWKISDWELLINVLHSCVLFFKIANRL